jgi:hypothetical protein
MQLKIVSDGTAVGTKCLDENEKPIGLIQKIQWEVSVDQPVVTAVITIAKLPADLVLKKENVTIQ